MLLSLLYLWNALVARKLEMVFWHVSLVLLTFAIAAFLLQKKLKNNVTCIRIKCKWNYKNETNDAAYTLQLLFPNNKGTVIHLRNVGMLTSDNFQYVLNILLEIKTILCWGRIFSKDCPRIEDLDYLKMHLNYETCHYMMN